MKRLILLTILVVLIAVLASSSVSAVPDTGMPSTYSGVLDSETAANQTEASNSSTSATITITMYTGDTE